MLVGKNTNVVHKGKIYHVQTEDSGINRPHIITLLYHGGNILASKKTSYADIVATEYREDVVKDIMEGQHNQMIRNLKTGMFDKPEEGAAESKSVDAVVLNAPTPQDK